MAVSDDYRDFVLEQLAPAGRVTTRAMFGGVGLYLDGLFFALIDDDTLYFKTDDSNRARYEKAGSRPFCPFPDQPDKAMAYWQVPAEALEDPDELAHLGARGDERCARRAHEAAGAPPLARPRSCGRSAVNANAVEIAGALRRDWSRGSGSSLRISRAQTRVMA